MKTILMRVTSAALLFGLAACQNTRSSSSLRSSDKFDRQTNETMNPVTRNYEQQPPYGPRGNKSDAN